MSYGEVALGYRSAARAQASERALFIRRTYAHLAGAFLAFVALEFVIFGLVPSAVLDSIMRQYFQTSFAQIVVVLAFLGCGYLARWWAYSGVVPGLQYVGLGIYVVLQAIIFVPLLWLVMHLLPPDQVTHLLVQAGVLTLCLFGGLTAVAFITRKDFSFLGPILAIASFLTIGLVILGAIFSFSLGLWFAFAMVALASGFILYDTSNVLHRFRTDMHVAASLELFASVAFLLYYIIIILLSRNSRS
jgi:FtsH-binding integral membrane protein